MIQPSLGDDAIFLDGLTEADVPAIVAGDNDAEHARRFGWQPGDSSEVNALTFVRDSASRWRQRERICFGIRPVNRRDLMGGVELNLEGAAEGRAKISYWVYPAFRRRDIATRAVGLVCRFGFQELGLVRIQLMCEPDNLGSLGVARNCGFTEEGRLRSYVTGPDGHRLDMVLHSLLSSDDRG